MTPVFNVVEPGLLTQIQGAPYRGIRGKGMPLAGAADPLSRALANLLVGNSAEAPAIETGFAPLMLEALAPVSLAVTGAAAEHILVDGKNMKPYRTIELKRGSYLRLEGARTGCRSYIAVAGGGFSCPMLMNAQSTYIPGGFGGQGVLKAQDNLSAAGKPIAGRIRKLPRELRIPCTNSYLLRLTRAPESDTANIDTLCNDTGWTVSRRADRIGLELDGPVLPAGTTDMLSSAMFPGTIQAPPGGSPFLLGPDAATMGGYPRIAQLIRADRHLIGQLRPDSHIRFVTVEPDEAQKIYSGKMRQLKKWLPDLILD